MDENLANTVIGHYRILRNIGSGGMATVYEAEDLNLNRRVALKFIPEKFAEDAHSVSRFQIEAQAASALNHPNICAVYQVDEFDGRQYIAMELLYGQTLKEMIAGKPLPVDTVLDLALQIAAALGAAHAQSIVHRDIKPTNVFITTEGQVKLFDFGIAKLTAPDQKPISKLTRTGIVLGSNGYAAPEQIRTEAIDQRSDIFAFGSVLYEMLTGKRAFERKTRVETMVAVLSDNPPAVSKSAPGIPPALERIVSRCLEKKPAQRFQSAAELAAALDAVRNPSAATADATPKPRWSFQNLFRR